VVIGSRGGKGAYRVLQALIFNKNVCVCGGSGGGDERERKYAQELETSE